MYSMFSITQKYHLYLVAIVASNNVGMLQLPSENVHIESVDH